MNTRRLIATSLVPAGLLAGSAAAMGTADVDLTQVLDRMNTLENEVGRLRGVEAELARLRAETGADARDQARRDEIRGVVADALADADTRSSLLQSGGSGGWDGGFYLGSADGNYKMNINGLMQLRYVHSLRDGSADDSVGGFENQRTYLTFSGNVVDPSWIYKIQGGFDSTSGEDGDFELLDAYIAKVLGDGFLLIAGQVKVPMLREAGMDEAGVQGASRSLMSDEFDPMRTQGVALAYNQDTWKIVGAITDGHDATGGSNTAWNTADVDISFTTRAEFLLAGDWGQFGDMTSAPGAEYGLMIGGAFHVQEGETGSTAAEVNATQWTIDVSAEFDGANVFVAYVDRDVTGTASDASGLIAQGGYYFADDLEVFGRYEFLDREDDTDELSILTVGVNKYFAGSNSKFTADLGYAFDSVSAFWSGGAGSLGAGGVVNGWQQDAAGEDGQMVLRAQFQLAF